LEVNLFDGRTVTATVVAFDPDADLVLLRSDEIPRTDAAPWATTPPTAGMLAVAVSHANRSVAVAPVFVMAAPDADRRVRTTSAALVPGTPLFTTAGEVFAITAGSDEPAAALIAPVVARLRARIASGQARRGALGLTFQPRDGLLAKAFPASGVLVADVAPLGPADLAGLLPGDVLTSIGDNDVTTPDEARRVIAALTPQGTATVNVIRAGKPLSLDVTPTSALGLRVRQAPRDDRSEAPEIRLVFDDERWRALDVSPEARVLAINGTSTESLAEARAVLRRARTPVLLVYVEDARGRHFQMVERPE
jgi:S1-C subfamily serine protease